MDFLLRNKIAVISMVVVIIGMVWYLSSTTSSDTSGSAISTENNNQQEQSLVNSLLALRSITLSGDIFSNQAFKSLKDNSTQIVAEPIGRDDPFKALGASVQPTVNTTQGAQIFKSSKK